MSVLNPSWAAQNYRLNKERIYENQKRYRKNNQTKIRKYYTELQNDYRRRLKNTVIKIIGGYQCVNCVCNDPDVLQIDHINNTGSLDKKRFKTQDYFYSYYIKHPLEAFENLQVLCANCNWKKYQESRK